MEDDDEIGGIAVHPLMELCPDELPELPVLVNGGNGIATGVGPCSWLIGGSCGLVIGGDVHEGVAADADTLDPTMLTM